ncbi:MAG: type II toxin-antitoxin system HigB family toxin [Bacteroidetes bacterium]|nr:type II toxin-antitoxin system HigB family toxin [Bacteroidota bacterium]
MRVIARKTLKDFWKMSEYKDSETSLREWFTEARSANWKTPHDVKAKYASASIIRNDRVVFNIKGNDYRLVAAIKYDLGIIYIRFVGTHKQYDKINAEEI